MAGLVVIDFIDMESNSNIRKVEKAMKSALADDRARIQVGRISSFGLMEMSRQRLRTGVLEASTKVCPHCEGTGLVRTASSAGLSALRMLEDEAGRGRGAKLVLTASREAALYVLNKKRSELGAIEERYGVLIEVASDNEEEGARMSVDVSGPPPVFTPRVEAPVYEDDEDELIEDIVEEEDEDESEEEAPRGRSPAEAREGREDGEAGRGRRRRRRGRRGRRDDEPATENAEGSAEEPAEGAAEDVERDEAETTSVPVGEEGERKRRGRRGGRRRRGRGGVERSDEQSEGNAASAESDLAELSTPVVEAVSADEPAVKPKRVRKPKAVDSEAVLKAVEAKSEVPTAEKPKRVRKKKDDSVTKAVSDDVASIEVVETKAEQAEKPKRVRKTKASEAVVAVASGTRIVVPNGAAA